MVVAFDMSREVATLLIAIFVGGAFARVWPAAASVPWRSGSGWRSRTLSRPQGLINFPFLTFVTPSPLA